MADDKVAAVIVTHNPCLAQLQRLLHAVSCQLDFVIVVDNSSENVNQVQQLDDENPKVIYTYLSDNFGIGYAQNVGIRRAHYLGAAFVLTLDQDSLPSEGMVSRLKYEFAGSVSSTRIAAVGPLLKDETTQIFLPFFTYSSGRKKRISPDGNSGVFDVGFLVSSGSMISMAAFKEIGLMREELFMSYVDVEFGLRARSAGFRILACCETSMVHNLGDRQLRLGPWIVAVHSSFRQYHFMRGGIYMQKLDNVPSSWKRGDRIQMAKRFILFSILGLPHLREMRAMVRGLLAGIKLAVEPPKALEAPDAEF